MSERICEWRYSEPDNAWATACGHMFVFVDEGPEENGAKFCQYCGSRLVPVREKEPAR